MTFGTVLIANRGEVALRIIRACRRLNLKTVAVYAEADRGMAYLDLADTAVCIGPGPARQSYLDSGALLLAARATGAQAIHPGYGFLSENADFAQAVADAGLTFIGPSPACIRMMGDKIRAKQAMRAHGVPCVPGSDMALPEDMAACHELGLIVGYPLIIKAAGGGGGRGMRVVRSHTQLADLLSATREEARAAFNNPDVYMERFLEHPRHIEIQVLCDAHGQAVWLGERDCSVQRRHQKLVEEAPAPGVPRAAIRQLGELCVRACLGMDYRGLGTFEFLYEDGTFAFIEMNTRMQVEHPVTEAITGRDLIADQIRVARGEPLGYTQADVAFSGHAIECRINAEQPFTGQPSPGTVSALHVPGGPGIRFDSHLTRGALVSSFYDSLTGKLIVTGRDRAQALDRMAAALAELRVDGVMVNTALHRRIVADEAFRAGGVSIHYLDSLLCEPATADPACEPSTALQEAG